MNILQYIGAATAAHQVEGNNTNSDIWAMEYMKYGGYPEKSGIAANHYNTYKEDILKMKEAGLNAYRFTVEWARIEPEEGRFDQEATDHYRDVISFCKENGIEPIVTLHHFSSPKWLISKGGWENEGVIDCFARYTEYVCEQYGSRLKYVCTINEANMGVLIAIYIRQAMEQRAKNEGSDTKLQIGIDLESMAREEQEKIQENLSVFGVENPAVFVSPRTPEGNEIVKQAHKKAVQTIHECCPHIKAGMTLSLRDIQHTDDGKERAEAAWEEEFRQFLPAIQSDDFFGVQNYTRTIFGKDGELPPEESAELTQMGYEFYPWGLENVIRKVHDDFSGELMITENGIATDDDSRRIAYIREAISGVNSCIRDGINISGYMYWSLIDNYEWQSGYSMRFGLMERNADHTSKPSLSFLGSLAKDTGNT